MKRNLLAFLMLMASFATSGFCCNLSDYSLTSVTYDSNTSEWVINTLLHIGSGRTGTAKGADSDTRSISFGFYKACAPFSVHSFSPDTLNATFSACRNPGMDLGPQGSPYNSQATILYIDPGYYGITPCVTQPLACITSTALCGPINQTSYNITFRTNNIPDSIRVFGVEGGALSGCYPNLDMRIDFCGLGYCTPNILCPGPQQVFADQNC